MNGFFQKHWRKIVAAAIALPVLGYVGLSLVIGQGVRGAVANAQERFTGDPVTALSAVATSPELGLSERNRAIWALGQLGDASALPVLQSLVTNEPCDHEGKICQHEVASALKGCGGGVNIGAIIWRHGELALSRPD